METCQLTVDRAIVLLILVAQHSCKGLHPTPFLKPASIMGAGSNILYLTDVNARSLKCPNGRLPARTGALGEDIYLGYTKLPGLAGDVFRGQLGRKAGALFRPGETNRATTGPAERITVGVGYGHNSIVIC